MKPLVNRDPGDETTCVEHDDGHEHRWVEEFWPDDDDHCGVCGMLWLDWTRGFGSNVQPRKTR